MDGRRIVDCRSRRWWWRDARRNAVVDAVEVVEDVLISELIETEHVRPLAGSQLRSWCWRHERNRIERWRRWRTNQRIVKVVQASLVLRVLDRSLERVRRAGGLNDRVDERHKNTKVGELEVKIELLACVIESNGSRQKIY